MARSGQGRDLPLRAGIVAALLIAPLLAGAGSVYRWVDEEGVVHYTQHAPMGVDAQRVDPGTANAVRRDMQSAGTDVREADEDSEPAGEQARRAQLEQREADALAEVERVRQENCRRARAQFEQLTTHPRIKVRGEDGEVRMLSEEERQSRIDDAKEAILANCDDGG